MSFGYFMGQFYQARVLPPIRQRLFTRLGLACILAFFAVRLLNGYGNAQPFEAHASWGATFFSFFNVEKYPPSLSYLLITLGPVFLFLGRAEKLKEGIFSWFSTFGKVPFFFYILHIYLIHLLAMAWAECTGYSWRDMILTGFVSLQPQLRGFGVDLWGVYLVWVAVLLLLYPLCKSFAAYKRAHKEKAWLRYL